MDLEHCLAFLPEIMLIVLYHLDFGWLIKKTQKSMSFSEKSSSEAHGNKLEINQSVSRIQQIWLSNKDSL